MQRREGEAFFSDLLKQGRIQSGLKDDVPSFMDSLSNDGTVTFSDPDGKRMGQLDWFRRFLANRPPLVHLGRQSIVPDGPPEFDRGDASFAAPRGYTVDEASADLHRKALAYQKANKCDYSTAVRAVSRERR